MPPEPPSQGQPDRVPVQSRRIINWIDGEWIDGNPPIMGPMTHAAWMASTAFDGARAFGGVAPDLDRHSARCIRSAEILGLAPKITVDEMVALAWEGIDRFGEKPELYIKPMFYGEEGFVSPRPETTRFVLSIFEAPMPEPKGFTAHLSPFRRPTPESAPTLAKAACLYPQSARAMRAAREAGFGNAVMLDANGNVAEFATANIFAVKDGVAATPVANGTFLDGITRRRVIELLRADGREVAETTLTPADLMEADEIFSTGNYAKVTPLLQLVDRTFQPGPVYARARTLYMDWAKTTRRPG